MTGNRIKYSSLADLEQISLCYASSFPDSLSTKQGFRFIRKMLEWYIVSERGVLFHLLDDSGSIVGFCGGIITRYPGMMGAFSSISQYAFWDSCKSYLRKPWLFFHPENLKKFPYLAKNIFIKLGIFYKANPLPPSETNSFYPSLGLVVIGVSGNHQRCGLGSILLAEFEQFAHARNDINRITLTVKAHNLPALNFYLKNGWHVVSSNDKVNCLAKHL